MNVAVNVDVAIHRGDKWVLIQRGDAEDHAPGTISLVGGTLEQGNPADDALLATARREVLEEIGVELSGDFIFVESTIFPLADGSPVLNVVFLAELPDGQVPRIEAPAEVSAILVKTAAEIINELSYPEWTKQSITKAERIRVSSSDTRSAL